MEKHSIQLSVDAADSCSSDDVPGSPNAVVLSYGYWQRQFGGDPAVIGRNLTVDGAAWSVIGITPRGFSFLDFDADLIMPMRLDRSRVTLGGYFRPSIARLKPGVTLEQASEDVRRMIPIAIDSFPPAPGSSREQIMNSRLGPNLKPLKQTLIGDAGNVLWVLMATIGIVLLIACANVANLILVRTEGRQQELSIRAALGAGWKRIVGELLTENMILGLAGGVLGVVFARAGLRGLLAIAPANLPLVDQVTIGPIVLLFSFGLSLFSGLLFGVIPAFRYARPRLAKALNAGGRSSSASRERLRARGLLVIVQVALALVLLIGAGLMIRTFQELSDVNPGFANPEQIQTVQLTIPEAFGTGARACRAKAE